MDWTKLTRLLKCLNGAKDKKLTLSMDDVRCVKWCVDVALTVHPDFKSHTGATMTFGQGAAQSMSRKQKLNARSSAKAELVGINNAATMTPWMKLFMDAQGHKIKESMPHQDNKSMILLTKNSKKSSGKCTRALNIRCFFMTDQVEQGNVSIAHCPTEDMVGDCMSKPTQGGKFCKFCKEIMGNWVDPMRE